jgi:hypothetical protein
MKREFKIFCQIWSKKNAELHNWLFSNIFLGLLPIILSTLAMFFGLRLNKLGAPFVDGSILIFGATLTGASLSYFAEDLKRELKKTKRFLWMWLIGVLVISSAAYAMLIALKEYGPPGTQSDLVVAIVSLLLFLVGIAMNLHLAAVRLAYSDNELFNELRKSEVGALSKRAAQAKVVDGIKL